MSTNKKHNFFTPETSLVYPRPLGQIDSEPPFLFLSSMMTEVYGIPTASLDLSDREWPLPSYVSNPPPTIILPMVDYNPPICMTKPCRRKVSSRYSCRKSSITSIKSPPTTITPSPQPFLHSQLSHISVQQQTSYR